MSRVRPVRVEIWRDGEKVDESAIPGQFVNGKADLERPLNARAGDVISVVWEDERSHATPRPMTIRSITT